MHCSRSTQVGLRLALTCAMASCGPRDAEFDSTLSSAHQALGGWASIGNGVTFIDTQNPLGDSALIAYAGWNVNLAQAENWAGALYDARLKHLGVRYVFAVQGPADSLYNGQEIGNSKIVAALNARVGAHMGFIVIAGHSSGSFVAGELLQQLNTGADPSNALGSRIVYFDLDGDQKYVTASGINRLRRAYYVNARNHSNGTSSFNYGVMQSLGGTYASKGGWFEYDASGSGCNAGASGCVHITLVNTRPHNPANGSGTDYGNFAGRPVNTAWLDLKTGDAQLGQCATPHATVGHIETHYASLGGCRSPLGHPITSELGTPGATGFYTTFQNGGIYWSFWTNAHAVIGATYTAWAQQGWETGKLGFPTVDERDVNGNRQTDFVGGVIIIPPGGQPQVVLKGTGMPDAGPAFDAGSPSMDAGATTDAGPSPVDGGPAVDAGLAPFDAGHFLPDSGIGLSDGGTSRLPQSEVSGGCQALSAGQLTALGLVTLAFSTRRRRCQAAPTASL